MGGRLEQIAGVQVVTARLLGKLAVKNPEGTVRRYRVLAKGLPTILDGELEWLFGVEVSDNRLVPPPTCPTGLWRIMLAPDNIIPLTL